MSNYNKIAKFYDYFQYYCSWVHKNSIQFFSDYIENNSKILDIACGTGNLLKELINKNKTLKLYGIDESSEMIRCACKKIRGAKFIVGQAEKLPFQNNYFDLIVVTGAFYCFQNKEVVITECQRVLKTNGHLFIATVAFDNFFQRLVGNLCIKFSNNFSIICGLGNVDEGARYISIKNLKNMTERHNLSVTKADTKYYQILSNKFILFQKTA